MGDLISRSALIEEIDCQLSEIPNDGTMSYAMTVFVGDKLKHLINRQPTVEAEPVVHGMWIDGGCSNCGAYIPTDSFWDYISERECEFCYSCGAKMDGGVRK